MILKINEIDKIADLLLEEKIGVLPTDTIYGLHCVAQNIALVKQINRLKGREEETPLITLISEVSELDNFDLLLNKYSYDQINNFWPGPNTLIFNTADGATRSFRLPKNDFLLRLLKQTGPLVSTSANLHNQPFPIEITQIPLTFGSDVAFYVDGGKLENNASNIYFVERNKIHKVR